MPSGEEKVLEEISGGGFVINIKNFTILISKSFFRKLNIFIHHKLNYVCVAGSEF